MQTSPHQVTTLMHRRRFVGGTLGSIIGWSVDPMAGSNPSTGRVIHTVRGKIAADALGICLPHEHVQCDFIGAEQTGAHRWNRVEVVRRMHPLLKDLKKAGVDSFFDCTPAYIGRDPVILKTLAEEVDMHLITNTGFYGGANDRFLPKKAWTMSVKDMADHWRREFFEGIDASGIRPGFIKIGVDKISEDANQLSAVDDKLVQAAAVVSQETHLTVTCHTGGGKAGVTALKRFVDCGGEASRFIVAHADNHGWNYNQQVADLDGWVSFDAVGRRPLGQHLKLVPAMLAHRKERLLLSQDNGWYSVGEPKGGEVRPYTDLVLKFLPALLHNGTSQEDVDQVIRHNPVLAFGMPA